MALPAALTEGAQASGLFRQVITELSPDTQTEFGQHFPAEFSEVVRHRMASLVSDCTPETVVQMRGVLFDLVMSELFDTADRNRFFTPRPIPAFAAAWANPRPGEAVLDPCHGSSGFLLVLAAHAAGPGELAGVHLLGMDIDSAASWAGKTNLALPGYDTANLYCADAMDLASAPFPLEHFAIVAGNPSFSAKIVDPAILAQYHLGLDRKGAVLNQQYSDVLFVEAFLRYARPGGKVVLLVPDGLLTNTSGRLVRDFIIEQALIEAIVALPRRVFHNDAKSNILLLRKKENPAEMQHQPVLLGAVEHFTDELPLVLQQLKAGKP